MRRLILGLLPLAAVVSLLMVALWFAADAERAQSQLGRAYLWMLAACLCATSLLVGAILREGWQLIRRWRLAQPGSRLNARMALLIGVIAIPPVVLVSGFAMRFVDAGIDSWFRADVAASQANAEALGRDVLNSFERRARDSSSRYASSPEWSVGFDAQTTLDELLDEKGDSTYLSLYDDEGALRAIAFNTSAVVFPPAPSDAERLQVREAGQLASNERLNGVLVWRVLDQVAGVGVLQSVFPVPADLAPRLDELEQTAVDYAQLKFQRQAMKSTFLLILGLVSLLVLLAALYAAFVLTRRMIQPISDLAVAAGEIAAGRYGQAVAASSSDELGFLTQSFNHMSQELAAAQKRERSSREEIEQSRLQLQAILERLSAGVISFDGVVVLTANQAAGALLELDTESLIGLDLVEAATRFPRAAPLFEFLKARTVDERAHWRDEIRLQGEPARALLVRGTRLPGEGGASSVAVFDDAAVIALSQREAAWAEVAKRLAHEIKNPLTPIQLAAERLRHKYLSKMAPEEAAVLDRATQTIVSQVDALKRIVNAFGDYTRPAANEQERFDLRVLIDEVIALYEQSGQCRVHHEPSAEPVWLRAHRERLRQALINLFTNAIEASESQAIAEIDLHITLQPVGFVTISIRDHGQGLPADFDERWFEPYNTTKPKGSGLGLAWVKKVAEEQGGRVAAENAQGGGARFSICLPLTR